uniref:bacterial Ig-like domain-containing protein n=1 Tax=uncultured Bifidobacterium sp. TaxID=165187 RepID=UPI002596FDD6
GEDGLDLNMARYNIGGGNATDVAYGYPFMRQGAAVPGYWADTISGVAAKQANKDQVAEAFDPSDDAHYDWDKGASQEWWLKHGLETGDLDHVEMFANSAPWFLTESGYATGGYNSNANNLADPEKFAQYMVKVTDHLEDTYGFEADTIEPFNESETGYWGTPGTMADDGFGPDNTALIERYWERYYSDKDKSVTPYSDAVKKPQEGMHVDNDVQQETLKAMAAAMGEDDQTKLVATDATDSGQMVDSYNRYSDEVKNLLDQYNTHSYGTNRQRVARDIAQTDGKEISQSEVDGSWQSGGFDPYNFDNGLGMAGKINADVYTLQSKDFNFWQVVEDLYNMSTGSEDVYGNHANPAGENLNWGTVFISFDCTVADEDGNLYSERDVDNNGGSTEGLQSCSVLVNSKYNAVRAYTKFIHEGDSIIANNRTGDTMTATSADGQTQTVIHTNNSQSDQTFVIDLSKYGNIADDAAGTVYLTTEPQANEEAEHFFGATPEYMNKFSNQEQPEGSVVIDVAAKTATVTVPARSIASIQLTGVTGVADGVAGEDGGGYQLVGQSSNRPLAAVEVGGAATSLQDAATTTDEARSQTWILHDAGAPANRPTLHRYVLTTPDGKVLTASGGNTVLSDMDVETAKTTDAAIWILNTENGETYSLVNVEAQQALDCNGQATAAGTKVGLWESGGGAHQAWYIRSVEATGAKAVDIQTPVGTVPELPATVTPYYVWGEGQPVAVTWDTAALADQVGAEGVVTVTGTATDVYGNELHPTASVYVGTFTVTDPVSVTVGVGSSLAEVQAAAPATVDAHVGDSPAFAEAVTWDWSGVSDADFAATGKQVVPGTIAAGDGSDTTVAATLTVYVTEIGKGGNAINCAAVKASSEQGSDEWGPYPASNTCDGNLGTYWSTWHNGWTDDDPWLEYTFDKPTALTQIEVYPEQATNEGPLSQITVMYRDGDQWVNSGITMTPSQETGAGLPPVTADLSGLPATTGIRLDLDYGSVKDQSTFTKVAEVKMYEAAPAPAADATLADLRVDGVTIDGFDPATDSYTVTLAGDVTEYPHITAYAADNAATVTVNQASESNGGKATIAVTSADGTASKTVTVDFGSPLAKLARLDVTAPTKTEYQAGEDLDLTGMTVVAVYEKDGKVSAERTIAVDDPELAVSGYDSVVAGEKTVTVSYRGVSATFTVTVKAAPVEPGPEPQPNPDGTTEPSTPEAAGEGSTVANTGASVFGVMIAAVALAAVGIGLITLRVRRRD